jgi:hypothetical protein
MSPGASFTNAPIFAAGPMYEKQDTRIKILMVAATTLLTVAAGAALVFFAAIFWI